MTLLKQENIDNPEGLKYLLLVSVMSVYVGLFLCVLRCNEDQQCKWPANVLVLYKDFFVISLNLKEN
jgi:hypothetical protein